MISLNNNDKEQALLVVKIASSLKKSAALKGGGALRFVFNSSRRSEDLDYELDPDFPKYRLQEKIEKLLTELKIISTAPKQTDTTQRWKLVLPNEISLKLEFSRRGKVSPQNFKTTTVSFHSWGIPYTVPVFHLSLKDMFAQKIEAALSPSRTAPRDAYDLLYIIDFSFQTGEQLTISDETDRNKLIEKLSQIPEDFVQEELFPYLSQEEIKIFNYKEILVRLNERFECLEISQKIRNPAHKNSRYRL